MEHFIYSSFIWCFMFVCLFDCFCFLPAPFDHSFLFHADFKATHVFIDRAKHVCVQRQYQLPLHLHICIPLFIWVPNIYIYSISMESMMWLNITKQNKNKLHNWVFVFGLKTKKKKSHFCHFVTWKSVCDKIIELFQCFVDFVSTVAFSSVIFGTVEILRW